jgi:hypothetical protein
MNTLEKLLRIVLIAGIALAGAIMATVLLVSAAVALAVVYVVARIRGKPMVASAYWKAMPKGGFSFGKGAQPAAAPKAEAARPAFARRPKRSDVIDVEARDIP